MGLAFEIARAALRLPDGSAPSNATIAKKIIELAKAGERDPDRLCEGALKELRDQHAGTLGGLPIPRQHPE